MASWLPLISGKKNASLYLFSTLNVTEWDSSRVRLEFRWEVVLVKKMFLPSLIVVNVADYEVDFLFNLSKALCTFTFKIKMLTFLRLLFSRRALQAVLAVQNPHISVFPDPVEKQAVLIHILQGKLPDATPGLEHHLQCWSSIWQGAVVCVCGAMCCQDKDCV